MPTPTQRPLDRGQMLLPGTNFVVPESVMQSYYDQLGLEKQKRKAATGQAVAQFSNYFSMLSMFSTTAYGRGLLKPGPYTYEFLWRMRNQNPLATAIIDRRIQQMTRYSHHVLQPGKQLGWRIIHEEEYSQNFDADSPGMDRRKRRVRDFLKSPMKNPMHTNLRELFSIITEDVLTFGQVALIRLANPSKDEDKPYSYTLVDVTTIRPIVEVLIPLMQRYGYSEETARYAASEQAYKLNTQIQGNTVVRPVDLTDKAYVQEVDGRIVAGWRDDEISIGRLNPSGRLGFGYYGRSPLELCLQAMDAFLAAWRWNKGNFERNLPDRLLVFAGADTSGADVDEFTKRLAQKSQGMQSLAVMALPDPDVEPHMIELGDTAKDMEFVQVIMYLTSLACATFGMHPFEINMAPFQGGAGVVYQGEASNTSLMQSKSEGEIGLASWVAEFLNESVISHIDPDLRMVIDTSEMDYEKAYNIALLGEQVGWTMNEARLSLGWTLVDDPDANQPLNAAYQQLKAQEQQMQMAQQQGMQQQGQDAGGDSGGGDGQTDPDQQAAQQGQQQIAGATLKQKQDQSDQQSGDKRDASKQKVALQLAQQLHQQQMLKLKQKGDERLAHIKGRKAGRLWLDYV